MLRVGGTYSLCKAGTLPPSPRPVRHAGQGLGRPAFQPPHPQPPQLSRERCAEQSIWRFSILPASLTSSHFHFQVSFKHFTSITKNVCWFPMAAVSKLPHSLHCMVLESEIQNQFSWLKIKVLAGLCSAPSSRAQRLPALLGSRKPRTLWHSGLCFRPTWPLPSDAPACLL